MSSDSIFPGTSIAGHRLAGVDLAKNFAVFLVVVIHSQLWFLTSAQAGTTSVALTWVVVLSRGAVPLFFLYSGYFFARRFARTGRLGLGGSLGRLLAIYAVWCLLYAFLPGVLQAAKQSNSSRLLGYPVSLLHAISANPVRAIFSGTFYHLWFLPNLVFGLAVLGLSLRTQVTTTMAVICGALLVGMVWLAPLFIPDALNWTQFYTLRGAVFATFFTVLGGLQATGPAVSNKTSLIVLGSGILLLVVESFILSRLLHTPLVTIDESLSLVPVSLGAFWLSMQPVDSVSRPVLSIANRFTLGIYLLHPALLLFLVKLPFMATPLGPVLLPILGYAVALALVVALSRIPIMTKLIT